MNRHIGLPANVLATLLLLIVCQPLFGTTWYVRPDGGTRHSDRVRSGQCDGEGDAAYPGKGTNRHCAFKDVRYLWTDGIYTDGKSAPGWGWVIAGGDTVIIRGTLEKGVSYRIGQDGPNSGDHFGGIAGDPFNSGMPPPPSGTPAQPTRILGENYASCTAQNARTQLHGGHGVFVVLNLAGASYVDVECLDITDFSSCGRANQTDGCKTSYPLSDFAGNGIRWSNKSTHDTLRNVRIHGLAGAGMLGPTGDDVTMDHIDIVGNAGSGWNADAGDGTTGTGKLLVQNYSIEWNGCAEEYPIVDKLPYKDCTDDNNGGYGDGFGTTTIASNPGWQAHFDKGTVAYNTQDGLDALHLTGAGSSMTVTNTLAYGNMGQQIKVGGTSATIEHNVIFTNCNAMRQAIPGTPAGYNSRLSDFCRAADAGVVFTVNDGSTTTYSNNVMYSASAVGIEVEVSHTCDTPTCLVRQQNNIFLGFRNDKADGYPGGGSGELSHPLYMGPAAKAYRNPGSLFDHNTTFHTHSNWKCPAVGLHETHAFCGDPHLTDESWHLYGYGDVKPTAKSPSEKSFLDNSPMTNGPRQSTKVAAASAGAAIFIAGGCAGWRRRHKKPISG